MYTVKYIKTGEGTFDMQFSVKDSEGNLIVDQSTSELADPATGNIPVTFDTNVDDDLDEGATSAYGDMIRLGIAGDPPTKLTILDAATGLYFEIDSSLVTNKNNSTTLISTVDDNRDVTLIRGTVTMFDSLGNAHTLSLKFTKTSSNNWYWEANVPASSGSLSENSGTVVFNSDGSIETVSPNPPTLTFTPTGGAAAQVFTLNLGSGYDGVTQTSQNAVVSALSQDGSSAAFLSNISIDQNGYVLGVFSNGQSRNLAQIMVATVNNYSGLVSAGDNMYTVGANTGDPLIAEPGESTNTTIQSGALEQSNVDLSEEFTRMIVAQRGFQANARVINVSDTLLQETTNLVR